MPGNEDRDPLDSWLHQQVEPLPPPAGTFELITRRARRRKLRKLAVTVASAAVVAAGVAVAVPNALALHVSQPPTAANPVANGHSPTHPRPVTEQPNGSASHYTPHAPIPSSTPGNSAKPSGPVPANFQPSSVTFVSPSTAWVIGQAGTPGQCANANPDICTSVAWTDDAGKTWHGAPAPDTGAPSGNTGVSGIRFLDGVNGWAFGPELWATHDAGKTWTKVDTNGTRVIDLETAGNRAFAVWATCHGAAEPGSPGTALGAAADCTSFTLMTTVAGSDQWSAVGTATTGLTPGANPTSPVLAITPTTGYLLASDGTLYSGPLDGAWQPTGKPVCGQVTAPPLGPEPYRLLALENSTTPVVACSKPGGVQFYTSGNGGAGWTQPSLASGPGLYPPAGGLVSLAATSDGTLAVAGEYPGVYPDSLGRTGLFVLPVGRPQLPRVSVKDAPSGGFSYVGMTTATQGVALPYDTSLHEIWMTFDGGLTWVPVTPITPGN